jgi:hypothetical protein
MDRTDAAQYLLSDNRDLIRAADCLGPYALVYDRIVQTDAYKHSTFAGHVAIGTTNTANALVVASLSADGSPIIGIGYGVGGGAIGSRANGTMASPTAVAANDAVAVFGARGYNGSTWLTASKGAFVVWAAEAWNTGIHGTYATINTCPTGGGDPSMIERLRVTQNGSVGIGTNAPVASAKLHVAGVIATTSQINHPAAYSGGGQLYCVSNEVYAMDSSGNFNVLSPDPDFAAGKRVVQLSGNVYDNKPIEYVEAATLAAFLRGELKPDPSLVKSVVKPAHMKRDWTADENSKVTAQDAIIAAWQSDTNNVDVKGQKPEKYTPAPKPTWLVAAEQENTK